VTERSRGGGRAGDRTRGDAEVIWCFSEEDGKELWSIRLRKAFAPEDFDRVFRLEEQLGLFDRPLESLSPRWIRAPAG